MNSGTESGFQEILQWALWIIILGVLLFGLYKLIGFILG